MGTMNEYLSMAELLSRRTPWLGVETESGLCPGKQNERPYLALIKETDHKYVQLNVPVTGQQDSFLHA